MLNFQNPIWLVLLIPIPACVFFYFFPLGKLGGLPFPFRLWNAWGFAPRQRFLGLFLWLSRAMFCLAIVLLIVALAKPSITQQREVYFSPGSAIMLVMDLSPSMAAIDTEPYTRLEQSQTVISNFINKLANDSIGIVGFGSEASLMWPTTLHHDTVIRRLKELRIMSLGQGTALGLGLSVAALHLEKLSNKNKIIILFTDGSNNTGEIQPEGAADMIRELGIQLYIVGVGKEGTDIVQFVDPASGKFISGELSSAYNPQRLQRIAQIAGGKFFAARSNELLLYNLVSISNQESQQRNIGVRVEKRDLHIEFLFAAFYLILATFFLRFVFLKELL